MKRIATVSAALVLAVALSTGAASAAVKVGTDGADALVGTKYADHLTGGRGDDTASGKRGNDTYLYADNWGRDTVAAPGGTDTLDFSAHTGPVNGALCPEEADVPSLGGRADDGAGNTVRFSSRIENLRGGPEANTFYGCTGKNTLSSGAATTFLRTSAGTARRTPTSHHPATSTRASKPRPPPRCSTPAARRIC